VFTHSSDASPEGDASLSENFLDSLSPEQVQLLPYDWEFLARDPLHQINH
jgi:hypothetical protein